MSARAFPIWFAIPRLWRNENASGFRVFYVYFIFAYLFCAINRLIELKIENRSRTRIRRVHTRVRDEHNDACHCSHGFTAGVRSCYAPCKLCPHLFSNENATPWSTSELFVYDTYAENGAENESRTRSFE